MGLKELIKKDIDDLRSDQLVIISEQIKLLKKRTKPAYVSTHSIDEIRKMTSTSKSNWADDVITERQERG